jgi:hypothetical protein
MNTRLINKKYDCHLKVWNGSDCILEIVRKFNNKNEVLNYILSNVTIKHGLQYNIYQIDEIGNPKSDINWFIQ